ncbi:FadR/GntR family transcriptional regulator [Paenibacillus silvisoli]|uniref:FadR/GntR family transcriptional regulator n=1 Tax=Paenibacillus silvisoli TaxID=3110539 RepID=UPI002803A7C1|nr:FadR/GntR family transcriptional regulator [Paenibacillus silvisoli]
MTTNNETELTFEPIERKTMVMEITDRLLSYLLSGKIRPGAKLPAERQLSEAIGVGRSSLREALKALTVLGLLEVRHGDGTYLKRADSELLPRVIEWGLLLGEKRTMDLIEARQTIEVSVAKLAAARRDEGQLAELKEIVDRLDTTGNTNSVFEAYTESDIAFHMKLAEIAGNTVLRDMLTSIRSLLRVWIKSVVASEGSTQFSYEEHLAVYRAIEQGDPDAAARAMDAHMDSASSRLKQLIEAWNENEEQ